jgi:hypothetical protein
LSFTISGSSVSSHSGRDLPFRFFPFLSFLLLPLSDIGFLPFSPALAKKAGGGHARSAPKDFRKAYFLLQLLFLLHYYDRYSNMIIKIIHLK